MENYNNPQNQDDFGTTLVNATIQFFVGIGYFLFVVPFALWSKALNRLAIQKESGALRLGNINTLWPLLSYIKRLTFDFMFDALTFIVYPISILVAFYGFFDNISYFKEALFLFFIILIAGYYTPIGLSITRDLLQLFIVLPIRKLVSFFVKPAQHLDLTIDDKK